MWRGVAAVHTQVESTLGWLLDRQISCLYQCRGIGHGERQGRRDWIHKAVIKLSKARRPRFCAAVVVVLTGRRQLGLWRPYPAPATVSTCGALADAGAEVIIRVINRRCVVLPLSSFIPVSVVLYQSASPATP